MAPATAGRYAVDPDGWVKIELSATYRPDANITRAILAHEAAHYILDSSGIKERSTLENERLTDVCMFVCGFGEIVRCGHVAANGAVEYGNGHHLGYLSPRELPQVETFTLNLRTAGKLELPSRADELHRRLVHLAAGRPAAERLVRHYRAVHPNANLEEVYEALIDQLERDRR